MNPTQTHGPGKLVAQEGLIDYASKFGATKEEFQNMMHLLSNPEHWLSLALLRHETDQRAIADLDLQLASARAEVAELCGAMEKAKKTIVGCDPDWTAINELDSILAKHAKASQPGGTT